MSSLGDLKRRGFVAIAAAPWASSVRTQAAEAAPPERRFHYAALAMRELALSWGDQPYGAVLVQGGRVVGGERRARRMVTTGMAAATRSGRPASSQSGR